MAPGEQVAPNQPVTRHTLWLSLRLGGDNWLFEVEPDEERAIVVGSLLRAHVRVNRRDIAPVHFHFEREKDRMRVCPAYSADLYVNGTRISGPYELEDHATIAFAGLELEAYVCDIEPNILEQLDLRDWTADDLPDCGAVLSLPDGAEVTRAIQRTSIAPEAPAGETKKYAPLCDSYQQRDPNPGLSTNDERDLGDARASCVGDAVRASSIVSVGTAPTEAADASLDCEPTLPGVGAVARSPAANAPKPELEPTFDNFPSTAPVCSDQVDDTNEPSQSLLARIGLASRKRPLAATLAVASGAAVLSLAMLAMDGIVSRDARERPAAERLHASTSMAAPASQLPSSAALSEEPVPNSTEPVIAVASPSAPPLAPRSNRRAPPLAPSSGRAKSTAHGARSPSTRSVEANPSVRSGL
ncbi:MAG: FHA domain-containing protein [Myxococcota bacterium]